MASETTPSFHRHPGSNYKIGGYGITLTGAALSDIYCSGSYNEISLPMTLKLTNDQRARRHRDSFDVLRCLERSGASRNTGEAISSRGRR